MQSIVDVDRLKPLGTHVLVKKGPVATHIGRFEVPECFRNRNSAKGMLFEGIAIAVGDRTKSAKYGHSRDHFEPGDSLWFWHMWDWDDHEVVIKDGKTKDDYLLVDESDIHAFKIGDAE